MLNRYKKKRDLFEVVIIIQVIEMFTRLSFLNVKETSLIYIVYIDAFCPYHFYKQHDLEIVYIMDTFSKYLNSLTCHDMKNY